jgi:stage II sporulation protein GA (sporulation sigma-E factor processing peptidase)
MLLYIYIDVLYLENFIMNYIVLLITSKYLKREIKVRTMIFCSVLASLYSIFVFFPSMTMYYTFAAKLSISFIIVLLAFKGKSIGEYIKNLAVFYIMNIIFGGCTLGMFYLSGNSGYYNNGVFYIYNFPLRIFLFGICASYIVFKIVYKTIYSRKLQNSYINIVINFENRQVKLVGLIDTGNFLSDPLTNNPVIVAQLSSVKDILPSDIAAVYENNSIGDFESLVNVLKQSKWMTRFRLIPFSAVGTQNGMIMGFKPDFIKIADKTSDKLIKNVIVAISTNDLSNDNNYQVLLNPDILNN